MDHYMLDHLRVRMVAIRRNNVIILQVLLNCPRVDPNMPDQDGNSPVMIAIKEEKRIVASMLIKCPRVDLRTRDRNGASLQRIARWEESKFEF